MLILSRRTGQGIRIGDSIRISVVAIDGQFVRLGIEAPASSKILREELWHSVANDNQEAASSVALAGVFAQAKGEQAKGTPESS